MTSLMALLNSRHLAESNRVAVESSLITANTQCLLSILSERIALGRPLRLEAGGQSGLDILDHVFGSDWTVTEYTAVAICPKMLPSSPMTLLTMLPSSHSRLQGGATIHLCHAKVR